jgi:hypothetical protein
MINRKFERISWCKHSSFYSEHHLLTRRSKWLSRRKHSSFLGASFTNKMSERLARCKHSSLLGEATVIKKTKCFPVQTL